MSAEDQPWYATRSVVWSGALLALIVLVGAGMALAGAGGKATSSSAPSKRAAAIARDGVCGLPVGSQDPVVGPPRTTWTLLGRIAAPSVPNVGPGVVDGHDRRCFAHSPAGAAVAAANLVAMTDLPGDSLSAEQLRAHFVPSRTVDVYLRQPAGESNPNVRLQIAGVQTRVDGRDDVTVTLAARNQHGALAAIVMPMHWMAPGDWRVRVGSPQEPFSVTQAASLDGFVIWGGA